MMWFDLEKKPSRTSAPGYLRMKHGIALHLTQSKPSCPAPSLHQTTHKNLQPRFGVTNLGYLPSRPGPRETDPSTTESHLSVSAPPPPANMPSTLPLPASIVTQEKGGSRVSAMSTGFPPLHPALRLLLRRGHVGRVWCGGPPCMVPRQQRRHINCPTDCVCRISDVDQAYFLLCKQKKHHTETDTTPVCQPRYSPNQPSNSPVQTNKQPVLPEQPSWNSTPP